MAARTNAQAGNEISNPRTGQRMVFRKTGADSVGRELIIECWSPVHPAGEPHEPMHTHPKQEKTFRVVDGELTVLMGDHERTLREGEEMIVSAGVPHSFWNGSTANAHYWQEFRPALRSAEFFTTLFSLARDGKLDARGMPAPLQLAASGARFRDEIMVTQPPPWVQRVVFAVLSPVARLLGYEAEKQ